MLLSPSSLSAQQKLARYCRSGETTHISGADPLRLTHYRRLTSGIIRDHLNNAYPLTKNLLEAAEWEDLMMSFFQLHKCSSAQIWQMPRELLDFLKQGTHPLTKKYPFLLDLVLFEWLEIEVFMMQDLDPGPFRHNGDPAVHAVRINPEIRVAMLQYPVHLKNAAHIEAGDEGTYFVALHRHPGNGKVIMSNLSAAYWGLIRKMMEAQEPYNALLPVLEAYAPQTEARTALNNFLAQGLESRLILGFIH